MERFPRDKSRTASRTILNPFDMRKIFLALVFVLLSGVVATAQEKSTKVVTDSVAFMPSSVKICEGVSSNGNPKYWIELPTENGVRKVSMSQSHATSNRLLALIERKDEQTGKYYYSIKFAEPKKKTGTDGKANLSSLK